MSWLAVQDGPPASANDVARALESVLGRAEFQEQGEGWLSKAVKKLLDWLGDLFDLPALPDTPALAVVLYVLLGLVAAGLAWILLRKLRQRARQEQPLARLAETLAERVTRLLSEARAAESAGDHLLALRLYFWVLVIGLSQRGDLTYRDAWTGREMLERGKANPDVRSRLAPLVPELDRKSFGGEPVSAADSERMANTVHELLGVR